MATSVDYIEMVCEQVPHSYSVRYKKMFGEYLVYLDEKPVLLVCDNTVFVKKQAELTDLLAEADCGYPYEGAKEHYVLDIEDTELVHKVIDILVAITPLPRKRTGKQGK